MPVRVCARLLPTALAAVVVLVLAGCGSETDDDASTIVRTTTVIAGAGVVGYDRDTRTACPAPVEADPADGETREVTHVAGVSTVPADPQRIVVLSTQALDTVCALGLWERVVGAATVEGESPQPRYLGTGIAAIPRIGPVGAPDPALIEQARPDLILGSAPLDSLSWEQLETIAPTVFTGAPNDWRREFRDQADALGRGSAATPALDQYQSLAHDTGITLVSPQTEASVVRFTDDAITVLGSDSFAGQVLAETGARRPGRQQGGSFELATDHIATADGDLIYVLLAGPGGLEYGTDVMESDAWRDLGAAGDRRVFAVDDAVWTGYGLVAARTLVGDVGASLNGYVS